VQDGGILDCLDQAESEDRSWDTKSQFVRVMCCLEGWLRQGTISGRSRKADDREQIVHTTVASEANLANRTIRADDAEPGQQVDLCLRCHAHLGINRRTRSAYRRVGVTTGATVRVEPRPEALFCVRDAAGDRLNLLEFVQAGVKELRLLHSEIRNLTACSRIPSTWPWIARTVICHHHGGKHERER